MHTWLSYKNEYANEYISIHHNKINAYKINKALLDPNILSLLLWSKTRLGNEHIHLGLLHNFSYAITYKTKHKSWINIFGRDKIMVNSPEV
jgi:hypothetical protein